MIIIDNNNIKYKHMDPHESMNEYIDVQLNE